MSSRSASRPRASGSRRFRALALLLALSIPAAYYWREPLLTRVASLWIVDHPPQKADAIVLLGGGLDTRPFAVARLYKAGWAPVVVLTTPELRPAEAMGLAPAESVVARRVIEREGVPAAAIQVLPDIVTSTHDEAVVIEAWVKRSGAKRLLIVTNVFHTRRVRWLFGRVLDDDSVDVRVVAVPGYRYDGTNWWQHEMGLIDFQNEIVKFGFYLVKY